MEEYKFTRISEKSYEGLIDLYKRCFGLRVTKQELVDKYDTKVFGEQFVGFMANHKETNDNAAYYGVFPMQAYNKGKVLLVAQSGDTMTAPNHQKKGLFVALANKTYELANQLGIDFVFGFPNKNSYPGFQRKLNWKFFDFMYDFILQTGGIPFLELTAKYPVLKKMYSLLVKSKVKKITNLSLIKSSAFQHEIGVFRNEDFFEYKLNKGVIPISYMGFDLYLKLETHIYIGDVKRFDIIKMPEFVQALNALGKLLFAKKVVFSMSKNHWLFSEIGKVVEAEESLPIGFLPTPTEINFAEMVFSRLDYDTF